MPRTYLVFGDIEGKFDVLRVECTKCDRKGRYHVHKLIEKHCRKGNMMKWREMLNADCPKRDARFLITEPRKSSTFCASCGIPFFPWPGLPASSAS